MLFWTQEFSLWPEVLVAVEVFHRGKFSLTKNRFGNRKECEMNLKLIAKEGERHGNPQMYNSRDSSQDDGDAMPRQRRCCGQVQKDDV
jgi:hypothetical protein